MVYISKEKQIITEEISSVLSDKQSKKAQITHPDTHKKQTSETEHKEKEETAGPSRTKQKGIYTTEKGKTQRCIKPTGKKSKIS